MSAGEAGKVKWTAIVLTCPSTDWTHTLQEELEIRQSKGYIDKDVFLLTVEDPKQYVGSGGATVNALLTVAEYISAQRGYTVLNPDVLQDCHILILHHGRSYVYDSCGRPFTTLPAKYQSADHDGLACMLDVLIKVITEKVAVKSSPGIWVSSTDMILTIPHDTEIAWQPCDACAITVPSTPQYCRNNGVYKLDNKGYVEDILFKESLDKLETCERPDGTVPMVCGLVYFSYPIVEKLLNFHSMPPLDACTYFGVDSGEPAIQLSLFFDVMLPMCSGVNEHDFRAGERSGSFGKQAVDSVESRTMKLARMLLWKDLHPYRIHTLMIESGSCVYPNTLQEHRKNLQQRAVASCLPPGTLTWSNITHSCIQNTKLVDSTACMINSVLDGEVSVGSRSLVSHCYLSKDVQIGKESFIAGLVIGDMDQKYHGKRDKQKTVKFPDSVVLQGFHIYLPSLATTQYVITTHGRFDNVTMPMWKSASTFCNEPWLVFMNRTGIIKEDLWAPDVENDDQTIMSARMFPVFHPKDKVTIHELLWLQGVVTDTDGQLLKRWRLSWRLSLNEILGFTDIKAEFAFRRKLFCRVGQHQICDVLKGQKNVGFRSLYNSAVVEGYWQELLETLDSVSEEHTDALQAGIAARTLANIADVLGCKAGPKGGLRSGPAANKAWAKAFDLLESGNISAGISALAKERANWLDRPDKLIRAARHYEGAAQILIRHAVMTAKQFFTSTAELPPPLGVWVVVECAARIDVAGGWSDTPPITYEHGGAVAVVGLLINGQRPIGAKTRRIREPRLVLVIHGTGDKKEVVCEELSDLEDYNHPNSPGALLKAAFVCAELIDLHSSESLRDQLLSRYMGGFELHSWANLPRGSGLGTSSILAGAVMASLLKAAGKSCDKTGLIHAVLHLEQLLTTGGGWQDQVGGILGGIRLAISDSKLPLYVDAVDLKLREDTIKEFNDRIVLIYTGKTRLARNLLQDVVRNWYARNPLILQTEDDLVQLATNTSKYFIEGNMAAVGKCMDLYWRLKKLMAPGCEPEAVTKLMAQFRPYALGMCMAGAGGGGFMYVLAIDHSHKKLIKYIVDKMDASEGVEAYDACVDMEGMKVTVEQARDTWDSGSEDDSEMINMHDYYSQGEGGLGQLAGAGGDAAGVDEDKNGADTEKAAVGEAGNDADGEKLVVAEVNNSVDTEKVAVSEVMDGDADITKAFMAEVTNGEADTEKIDASEVMNADADTAKAVMTGVGNDGLIGASGDDTGCLPTSKLDTALETEQAPANNGTNTNAAGGDGQIEEHNSTCVEEDNCTSIKTETSAASEHLDLADKTELQNEEINTTVMSERTSDIQGQTAEDNKP